MQLRDLYIVGDQSKKEAEQKDEWHQHKQGLILRVSPQNNSAEMCVEYVTPLEARPEEDPMIIGFSRIRPTKIRENVQWIKHRFGLSENAGKQPARIALYNVKERKLCWEQNLEEAGLNVIFSIHPVAEQVQ